jgi:hypothetical protein
MRLYRFIQDAQTKMKTQERPSNLHVEYPGFETMYVRYTKRNLEGRMRECLDLAGLCANVPGRGAFTLLLTKLRQDYPDLPLFVESVLTDRFCNKLLRLGFKPVPYSEPPCFYMLPTD